MRDASTVLRSVAWRDGAVRVCTPQREAPCVQLVVDPVALGQAEGLRRGLDEGRRLGLEAGARQGREEGLAQGLAQGLAEGRRLAQQELEAARDTLRRESQLLHEQATAMARSMERALADLLAEGENQLVALCLDTLGRVLGQAFATPQGVRAQVGHLLADRRGGGAIDVHVHPSHAAVINAGGPVVTTTTTIPTATCIPTATPIPPTTPIPTATAVPTTTAVPTATATTTTTTTTTTGSLVDVRWVADDQVVLGGCRVRCDAQDVDARLETVLQALKSALAGGLAMHRAEAAFAGGLAMHRAEAALAGGLAMHRAEAALPEVSP